MFLSGVNAHSYCNLFVFFCFNKGCCFFGFFCLTSWFSNSYTHAVSFLTWLSALCRMCSTRAIYCISGDSTACRKIDLVQFCFFLISQLWAKFECNVTHTHTHTHSHYMIFNIKANTQSCVYFTVSTKLWRVHLPVFIIKVSFFFQFDILEIDASGWLNVIKQIKQAQPVLNMKNSAHWAYLKLLKVKHQNGFEGYLILTGARSPLTTLIKPQYIALHMSGNPRFQYYSKPEWCFLRCWGNVTYLFFPPFSPPPKKKNTFLVYLEVTKSAPCSAAHNLTMWHKHDKKCSIRPLKA